MSGIIFMPVDAIVSALWLANDQKKKIKLAILAVSVLGVRMIPRVSVVQS